jgi:hypothetical protein
LVLVVALSNATIAQKCGVAQPSSMVVARLGAPGCGECGWRETSLKV